MFFHGNHPIKWVRIAGIVVAIDEYSGRRVVTVDDSSGTNIECVVSLPAPVPSTAPAATAEPTTIAQKAPAALTAAIQPVAGPDAVKTPENICDVDVGFAVDVKGGLKVFRDQKQIKVEKMVRVRSTEQEMRFWAKVNKFRGDVLSKPWVLDKREVRKCRKQAEGNTDGPTRDGAKRRKQAVNKKEAASSRRETREVVSAPETGPSKVKESGLERRVRATGRTVLPAGTLKYDALGI